jgi:hypothetical protein
MENSPIGNLLEYKARQERSALEYIREIEYWAEYKPKSSKELRRKEVLLNMYRTALEEILWEFQRGFLSLWFDYL